MHRTLAVPASARRGVALLVILATLAVLVILAIAFARTSSVERSASRSFADSVRAELVASAGIEAAVARLESDVRMGRLARGDWLYRGEDWDADGTLDVHPRVVEDVDGDGTLDLESLPLSKALAPSYALDEDRDGRADLVDLGEGAAASFVGISGFVADPEEEEGSFYSLRIRDLSALLYVNQGNVSDPAECADPGRASNRSAVRIFDNLGQILGASPRLGVRLVSGRPPGGYRDVSALAAAIGSTDLELVRPYVTTEAWVDDQTMAPDPELATRRPAAGQILWLHPAGQDTISPAWMTDDPRAPVNVNSAERPVLAALVLGLAARYHVDTMNGPAGAGWTPVMAETRAITAAQALAIADRILEYRSGTLARDTRAYHTPGAFDTWSEFYEFVDLYLLGRTATGIDTPEAAAVLKANFNPNTDLTAFNPNLVLWKPVDKGDLLAFTTEFTFRPTGIFEIESIGRVLRDERQVAVHAIRSAQAIYRIHRLSTQQQFEAAGHEKSPNRESSVSYSTMAHATVDTYPECDRLGDFDKVDGQIGPATVESVETPAIDRRLAFRASYNGQGPDNTGNWVLPNVHTGSDGLSTQSATTRAVSAFNNDRSIFKTRASADPADPSNPGNVLPDGCLLSGNDLWRHVGAIAYHGNNARGPDGSFSRVTVVYWAKAPWNWKPATDNGRTSWWNSLVYLCDRGVTQGGGSGDGWTNRYYYDEYSRMWGSNPDWRAAFDYPLLSKWQENSGGVDWNLVIPLDPQRRAAEKLGPHRWVLVAHTFGYDAFPRARRLGSSTALPWTRAQFLANTYYDRVFKSIRWLYNDDYDSFDYGDPLTTAEMGEWDWDDTRPGREIWTMDPLYSAPAWGNSAFVLALWGRSTVDELRFYDAFLCESSDRQLQVPRQGVFDMSEYLAIWQRGRYYNGRKPAAYQTAPLDLDAREVLALEWTAWVPGDARTTTNKPVGFFVEWTVSDGATTSAPLAGDGAQVPVQFPLNGQPRLGLEFTSSRPGDGIVECPFVDDVTIYYLPRSRRNILSYQHILD